MSFNARRVTSSATAGNLNTIVAGTATAAATLTTNQIEPGSLSATFAVDAETDTITLEAGWQVSRDNSTWLTVANGTQNAATVVLATGTAGADAAVTKVIPAPDCVYSFTYVRAVVINRVVTGNAADTYSITYDYMKPAGLW
jgi:hypothetical protein